MDAVSPNPTSIMTCRVELDAESGFDRANWPDEREAQNQLCRCLHWAAVRALWHPWERNEQDNQMRRLDLLRGLAYAFLDDYERLRAASVEIMRWDELDQGFQRTRRFLPIACYHMQSRTAQGQIPSVAEWATICPRVMAPMA